MSYDFLIVGAGWFGAVFAYEMTKHGKKCIVIDRRDHIGGNSYTEKIEGINVHKYGAHIFHTNDKNVWEFVNQFTDFNRYVNSPIAKYKGELYNLPFNMNTFYQLWGVKSPEEAKAQIDNQRFNIPDPKNLEEQALSLVGSDIYEKLIKGYTEKQWGRKCSDLPAFIIKRLPLRFTYDNNYFDDQYQGIPIGGYTRIFEQLLEGVEIRLNTPYKKDEIDAGHIIYSGAIDEYYTYKLGTLKYRSLKFDHEWFDVDNIQGNAVINYTSSDVPYTRTIEHKHFEFDEQLVSIVSKEYPQEWDIDKERYYPINDERNNKLYEKYHDLATIEKNIYFAGRLGTYKYLDMDEVIKSALVLSEKFVGH